MRTAMRDDALSQRTMAQDLDGNHDTASIRVFGFWVYIMSDCILFASLFVSFAVLHGNTAGGPSGREIIGLPGVLVETFCLLTSSFAYGLATLAMRHGQRSLVLAWLGVTFVLGAAFLGLEVGEFRRLILEGSGPGRSAFLSAFFALVGTHGLHVSCGMLWMAVLAGQVAAKGLSAPIRTRIMTLGLFWHFLDIVWICVFSFVYLAGVV
jgi:cytochrome o ubiquinol oxidase subunit III